MTETQEAQKIAEELKGIDADVFYQNWIEATEEDADYNEIDSINILLLEMGIC